MLDTSTIAEHRQEPRVDCWGSLSAHVLVRVVSAVPFSLFVIVFELVVRMLTVLFACVVCEPLSVC